MYETGKLVKHRNPFQSVVITATFCTVFLHDNDNPKQYLLKELTVVARIGAFTIDTGGIIKAIYGLGWLILELSVVSHSEQVFEGT